MGAIIAEADRPGSQTDEKIDVEQLDRTGVPPATLQSFAHLDEKKILRKMDMRLIPMLALLYLLSFLDRGNIGNAKIEGLQEDLGLTDDQYNWCLTAFFFTYAAFEVPSNLMLKRVRPSIWLPAIMIAWGIVMTLMGIVHNYAGLLSARIFLGVTEAGLFPGVAYYLTNWYKREEIQLRQAMFFSAASVAGAFSGLLALPKLTSFGGSMSRMRSSTGQIWVNIFVYWGVVCPLYGISLFLPTIIRHLGYQSSEAQLMTVPIYITAAILAVVAADFSDRVGKRSPFIVGFLLVMAVGFSMCIATDPKEQPRVVYAGVFVAACAIYPAFPGVIAWLSNNLSGSLKRSVGMAVQIGVGNLGGAMASNFYRARDAPRYRLGHGLELGFIGAGVVASLILVVGYTTENKKRARRIEEGALDSYTPQELSEKGDRAVTYRYVL
ncbi:hypothetical protein CHGG_03464 [Chaetomium globosum CBS 148.51]|uniref:Major facilitator superfamily (MFS) profile domain-containing protein n=1 Tax=Chaetomium globosum (strain ATCC 6205 / CBS 148.51 / DSM 1962 / NBRC 6347 / NRRL 1970) TaxID=306901 RepID=Q2H8J0_CHAGB|nr:uncharacterized protein CHGG_03464 [Chaetomium globosum CBS 148.51]EAQ91529.1 hypothetical protein CHGG_03464 [Chaetomium globosum CBS 148.51]